LTVFYNEKLILLIKFVPENKTIALALFYASITIRYPVKNSSSLIIGEFPTIEYSANV
jgi:hypothetical protein